MGKIADEVMQGEQCELCGVMFEEPHGFPVVCKDCYRELTKDEKKQYIRATKEEL